MGGEATARSWKSFCMFLQDNIIREFNLNEIFEKCKKFSKGRSERIEELRSGHNEQQSTRTLEEESESKKDK